MEKHSSVWHNIIAVVIALKVITTYGSIAQLARALPRQGRGRRFEPSCSHHKKGTLPFKKGAFLKVY